MSNDEILNRLKEGQNEIPSISLSDLPQLSEPIKELLSLGYGSLMKCSFKGINNPQLVLKVDGDRYFLLDENGKSLREITEKEDIKINSVLKINNDKKHTDDFLTRFKRAVNG